MRIFAKSLKALARHSCLFVILTLICLYVSLPKLVHASSRPYISGHGVNFATGNKYVQETDISIVGPVAGLVFKRTYNSQSTVSGILGYGWSGTFTEKLIDNTITITLVQNDGRHVAFAANGQGGFVSQLGSLRAITRTASGFQLVQANQDIHTYDSQGRLTAIAYRNGAGLTYTYAADQVATITDTLGRSLSFTYINGRLTGLATPAGNFTYRYDDNGNLTTVTRPDNSSRTYEYAATGDIHNLTGIVDETNTRIQTLTYDNSDRVITSSLANGLDAVTITYPTTMTREVTDSLGMKTTYQLETLHGVVMVGSTTGSGCSSCGSNTNTQYLYNRRLQVLEATDANGVKTTSTYDANGNRITRTEAFGTPLARTTTKTYTPQNQVATSTEPSVSNPGQSRVTSNTYDAQGNLLSRTVSGFAGTTAITETTAFTFSSLGQITAIDGPRTDVNDTLTLAYYPNEEGQGNNRGQLHTVTNPLGQATTYSNYTALGKPGTITDANGLTTTLAYDLRGQLLTRTTGGLTTSYAYDAAGRLLTATLPGSRTLTYTYSGNQVASVTDGLGNKISYTYDAKGQKTREEVRDQAGTLTAALGLSYDAAGNLSKRTYPDNAEDSSSYDAVRNLLQTLDPTAMQTDYQYDALRRLLNVTEAGTAVAAYTYDSQDNTTRVIDARGKSTTFTYDDLGRPLTVIAPDTGLTRFAYDSAGNLVSRTDAKGQTVSFTYDSLNRPTKQSAPGAGRDLLFTYDQPTLGRLASVQEEESTRSFAYDNLGRLTTETRTLGTTTATISYGYDSATGELASMTYPSGRVLTFSRDAAGRIAGLQVDGVALAAGIKYLPFGPMTDATLGSLSLSRGYDQRYQAVRLRTGNLEYGYTRDPAGQVTGVTNLPSPVTTGTTETATISPDNNQLTAISGGATRTYTYDAGGNITSDGTQTFTWDSLNRLIKVEKAGAVVATYGYDAQNRRIRKTVGSTTTHYHYDLNSQLIAETLADGTPLRDYFYLNGEPLALREYERNPGTYYFGNDHLGTPQQLIAADGVVAWQAAYLPYGQAQVQLATVLLPPGKTVIWLCSLFKWRCSGRPHGKKR